MINHALNNFFENSGDTIVVKDGTYHEALNIHQLYTYDYLTIRSENGAQNTIINAPNADQGNCISASIDNFTIDGFTLTGGSGWQGGGGIFSGEPILKNLIIIDNHVEEQGGGLLIHGGATLENIEIYGNTCSNQPSYGGGIAIVVEVGNNAPVFSNVNVYNNSAWQGGGIRSDYNFDFRNGTITNNNATDGGGVYIKNAIANIQRSTIAFNAGVQWRCYLSGW